jgi:hypothetical protein
MSKPLLSDRLWAVIEPLLPPEPPKPKGGRPRISDRAALTGILFVLRSGTPWELLPREMGCRLQRALLDRLGRRNAIDFSRAALDSASVAAKRGARRPARTRPTGASRAPNGTSSRTRTASPSLSG